MIKRRYKIVVQHEVIIYAENRQAAEKNLLATPFMRSRTNPECVSITQLPLPEDEKQEPLIDERKAPGS
jgi:hypothetical protein